MRTRNPDPQDSRAAFTASGKRKSKHLYVVACAEANAFKVGRAADVTSRVSALRTASPAPLELLGTYEDCGDLEGLIHQRLRKHRLQGEWFSGLNSGTFARLNRFLTELKQGQLRKAERIRCSEEKARKRHLKREFREIVAFLISCATMFPLGFTSRDAIDAAERGEVTEDDSLLSLPWAPIQRERNASWLSTRFRRIEERPFLGLRIVQDGNTELKAIRWRVLDAAGYAILLEARKIQFDLLRQRMEAVAERLTAPAAPGTGLE